MLQTITQQPKPTQVQVCTNESAFAVLENAKRLVVECTLEQNPTASRYFTQVAFVYASLVDAYYTHAEQDLIPVSAITDAIVKHLVYVEDAQVFADCVANTDLATLDLNDLTYLSN